MNLSELVETINKETTATQDWENNDFLSGLLLRLASYYSTLGQFVADAEANEDQAEMDYKFAREQAKVAKIEEGKSVEVSKSLADIQAKPKVDEYIKLKHKARLLFLTRQSLDKTMDAIRSRLAQQARDKEGSRHAV